MKSKSMWIGAIFSFILVVVPVWLVAQGQATEFRHYKLIDIGTFGGPASYINAQFALGAPNQINASGTAVGSSATSEPSLADSNGALCGGLDGILHSVFHAFRWQDGEVTDLGAIPGNDNCSVATSINAAGSIVGQSEIDIVDPLFGVKEFRAVLWKDGKIVNLGTFGGQYSVVHSINDRGQVCGLATNTIPDPFSLLYQLVGSSSGTQTRAFLWENGSKQDLGTLGGPDAQPFGMSEVGQVVGVSYTNSIPNPITGVPTAHPFLWTKERGMVDLGTLGGVWGSAGLLNNRGQVVGSSSLATGPGACFGVGDPANCHLFMWDHGKLVDLNTETRGGSLISANALNNGGEIVGTAAFPDRLFSDAYLWRKGVARDLGVVDDDCFSEAFAINSRDQIVGQSFSCTSNFIRTFLWESGTMVDLDLLAGPNASLQLVEAFAINDRGEIGGIGVPPGCGNFSDDACGHAFLLIPVCTDGSEGCADAPLDPTIVAQSQPASGASTQTMRAEQVASLKKIIARITGRKRRWGLWSRR